MNRTPRRPDHSAAEPDRDDGSASIQHRLLTAAERLGLALRAARQDVATQLRVSLLQLQVLEVLADGRGRRVGDLAAELAVSQPTMSDALAALQTKGLVTRRRDPADARARALALTPNGRRMAAEVTRRFAQEPVRQANPVVPRDHGIALRVLLEEIRRLQLAGVISVNRSCLSCQHYQSAGTSTTPRRRAPRCRLLNEALADVALRVDCPEHVSA